jgi:hypothetical protein
MRESPCLHLRRQAFGKTSTASTHDIDFFLPDTGPLSNDSYRKRLTTSMGTKKVKLPKSGVQVMEGAGCQGCMMLEMCEAATECSAA